MKRKRRRSPLVTTRALIVAALHCRIDAAGPGPFEHHTTEDLQSLFYGARVGEQCARARDEARRQGDLYHELTLRLLDPPPAAARLLRASWRRLIDEYEFVLLMDADPIVREYFADDELNNVVIVLTAHLTAVGRVVRCVYDIPTPKWTTTAGEGPLRAPYAPRWWWSSPVTGATRRSRRALATRMTVH
jgi:hypothetical protein